MTDEPDPPDRRSARRWYARIAIALAVVLIGGGALMAKAGGTARDLGVLAIGYGIGVFVAGCFLFAGWEPRRLKR